MLKKQIHKQVHKHINKQINILLPTIGLLVLPIILSLSLFVNQAEALAFTDTKGHWAKQAVETLAQEGIILGNDLGRFQPDQPVTRAELAVMLVRTIGPGEESPQEVPVFKDVYATQWYYPYIQEAAARQLVYGSSDSMYFPAQPVTRRSRRARR
jgi:hypothetical protein